MHQDHGDRFAVELRNSMKGGQDDGRDGVHFPRDERENPFGIEKRGGQSERNEKEEQTCCQWFVRRSGASFAANQEALQSTEMVAWIEEVSRINEVVDERTVHSLESRGSMSFLLFIHSVAGSESWSWMHVSSASFGERMQS